MQYRIRLVRGRVTPSSSRARLSVREAWFHAGRTERFDARSAQPNDDYGWYAPGTRLADPYPRPRQILLQPLVVLRQPPQLQLRHGLLVWARVHLVILEDNASGLCAIRCVTRQRTAGCSAPVDVQAGVLGWREKRASWWRRRSEMKGGEKDSAWVQARRRL